MKKSLYLKGSFSMLLDNFRHLPILSPNFACLTILFICLYYSHTANAQNDQPSKPKRNISWAELVHMWESDDPYEVFIKKVWCKEELHIEFNKEKDSAFVKWIPMDKDTFEHYGQFIMRHTDVAYRTVENRIFRRSELCDFTLYDKTIFKNCHFENSLYLRSANINNLIIFEECTFNKGVDIDAEYIDGTIFNKCVFLDKARLEIRSENAEKIEIRNTNIANVSVSFTSSDLCIFSGSNIEKLSFNWDTLSTLKFIECQIDSLLMHDVIVNKEIEFDSSKITSIISLSKFIFPDELNTRIPWNSIKHGKLATRDIKQIEPGKKKTGIFFQTSESTSSFQEEKIFNQLTALHQFFLRIYRLRGDRKSANACYVELKELETRRARFVWEQDNALTSWFNWRLGQFLKYFCDYGTSPVKALIRSMWTILLFAMLYFFFYSDWDRINRSFLIRQHRRLLRYFRSEIRLEELYHEDYQEEYQGYDAYRRELEESRVEVPYYIHLMGRPLYHLSLLRHRAMGSVYHRLEVLGGVWKELPPRRQWVTGALVGVAVGGYLLHLALVRTLNSVMLSINTFSTLGFGDIPVKGWIRYAAILEGFLR